MRSLLDQPVPEDHAYRLWANAVCAPLSDARFGIRTMGWWGMTETIAHGIVGTHDGEDTPMSMGRPAPGYAVYILDQHGAPVRAGETGDLFVGGVPGVSLFLGYADDPAATARAFRPDGLFITGDRVRVDEDGSLFFADRSKDMLKVGGENVAASEIESVIARVAGVAEVAVVAMPHAMLDEAPAAFVLPAADIPDDLPARIEMACADMTSGCPAFTSWLSPTSTSAT